MTRHLLFTAMVVLSCGAAAAWVWRVHSYEEGHKTIKFAYVGAPEDPRHQSALLFKQIVESRSKGAMRVELYYGGQLGGDRDAIEGVRLGTIEMTVAGAGIFANFEPQMGVTALPYLFDSFEQAWAFNDSEINRRVCQQLLAKGIRVLGHWDNGFRCVTNSIRPIETPSDMGGMRIRTPENPILLATISALGANPSPLQWTELYMALQQGAFDGQENPIPTIYVNKLYETQNYISTTNHVYEPMPLVISQYFWSDLSGDQRRIIQRAAERSQAFNRNLVRRLTAQLLGELELQGMIVSHPDRAAFREATAHVQDQFVDWIGGELIQAAYRYGQPLEQLTTPD